MFKQFINKLQNTELINNLKIENEKKLNEINLLKQQLSRYDLPKETVDLINYYDSKYEKKDITYKGLAIKTISKEVGNINPLILVCDYAHTTKSMKEWIVKNNLLFNETSTPENISKHMWKIYSEFTKHTKYITDKYLYGEEEKWISNFEQFYIKNKDDKWVADCESFALLCFGLIIASGIPRGLVRITTGKTVNNFGHASLTCWDWRTKKFEQWETTSTYTMVVKETEPIYIKTIWFSFDNEKSFSTLDKTQYEKIKN
jgi:predicted transglutaminase-like cysteine proteinase